MKITFLSGIHAGKLAKEMVLLSFILIGILMVGINSKVLIINHIFFPLLIIIAMATVISLVIALISGVIALTKNKEHSIAAKILIIISSISGILILLLILVSIILSLFIVY
ncbi:MAG: hypothetical protein ABRQ25_05835 [Clostridiaceae bacterium]